MRKAIAILALSLTMCLAGCSDTSSNSQDLEALQQFRDDESVRNPYTEEQISQLQTDMESYIASYGDVTTNQVYVSNGCMLIQGDMNGMHYMFKGFVDESDDGYTISNVIRYELY